MQNLWLRGHSWTFQIRIPTDLVDVFGRTPIRVKLAPSGRIAARRRARFLSGQSEVAFGMTRAKKRAKTPIPKNLREEMITELAMSAYARLDAALRFFTEIVGDKPLKTYMPIDLQEFANVLGRVPQNMHKKKRFDGMTLREAADYNDGLPQPLPRLSGTRQRIGYGLTSATALRTYNAVTLWKARERNTAGRPWNQKRSP